MKLLTITISIILILGLVKADLPVHCLKNQITGRWNLNLGAPVTSKSTEMVSCGHQSPDNEKTSWKAMQDLQSETTLTVDLADNDTVQGKVDNKDIKGQWTMIYDEGFEINYNSYKFFTMSKYVSNGMQYDSVCDQTLTGWYHNLNTGEKGCMNASKPNSKGEKTENVKQDKVVQPKDTQKESENQQEKTTTPLKTADDQQEKETEFISKQYELTPEPVLNSNIYEDSFIFTQTQQNDKKTHAKKSHLKKQKHTNKNLRKQDGTLNLHKEFNNHQQVVDRLNNVQKSWKASIPKDFEQFNLGEMNSRAGRIRNKNKSSPFTISFVQKGDGFQHYSREDISDLPTEFSWEQYLRDPVQQKDCGSCYAIATSEMISARLKIKYNEDVKISAQHSLDCNFYNQGCDGGYGFLVSKFASEYEMVPESCHPYKAVNGNCSNSCDVSKLDKTYKVTDYQYIGGAYGKSTERKMMEEMMENGPIVVSFEPNYDFMYYSEGIYHSVDAEEWLKDHEKQPAWEKVDHSVLAYGWGEDAKTGEKYWNVLNSWGTNWGENGHFRIRKGTDESHIESMGESAMPFIVNKKQ